jgi:long-chain acyl-CoA synthetase
VSTAATPARFSVAKDADLTAAVFDNAAGYPEDVVFRRRSAAPEGQERPDDAGGWSPVTASEFAEGVTGVAKGLVAAGIEPGDRVALMSATRYEWTLLDYALWTAGAVSVPIYETSSAEQIAFTIGDSGAVAFCYETPKHKSSYDEVAERLSQVRLTVDITDELDSLAEAGRDVDDAEIERRRAALGPDSLASIIYTSGTTGTPKGCRLTHGNFVVDVAAVTEGATELMSPGESTLLFLPLAHVFARLIEVGCVTNRVVMGHTADIANLLDDLAAFAPTFILAVPRVFEKVHTNASQQAHAAGTVKGWAFDRAEKVAIAYSEGLDRGGPGLLRRLEHALFDRLVYAKLRNALGGKLRFAVSGGAPLGSRLGHFFRGVGISVLEGYGLTENAAGASVNVPETVRIGTVGRPLPGTEMRVAENGELLIRGGQVFAGYWHRDEDTRAALDDDGWLHTGDLAEVDGDGFVTIVGRSKELIVTAGGKNVSPSLLEDRLRAQPLVSQCVVVGDRRPFIGALLTLDDEALTGWAAEHGRTDASAAALAGDEDLRAEIQAGVDEANQAVSRAESIRAFRILPRDLTEEGGQLTPTLKVKRAVVLAQFADDVEALYAVADASPS